MNILIFNSDIILLYFNHLWIR